MLEVCSVSWSPPRGGVIWRFVVVATSHRCLVERPVLLVHLEHGFLVTIREQQLQLRAQVCGQCCVL